MKILIGIQWVDCKDVRDHKEKDSTAQAGTLKFTKAVPTEAANILNSWYAEGIQDGPKNHTKILPFAGHVHGVYEGCFVWSVADNKKGIFQIRYTDVKL